MNNYMVFDKFQTGEEIAKEIDRIVSSEEYLRIKNKTDQTFYKLIHNINMDDPMNIEKVEAIINEIIHSESNLGVLIIALKKLILLLWTKYEIEKSFVDMLKERDKTIISMLNREIRP